jgi:hypothetical protein
VADADAAFVQGTFNIPKWERKPDIHHRCQADDLRIGFEVVKGGAFCYPPRLQNRPAFLKLICSDNVLGK